MSKLSRTEKKIGYIFILLILIGLLVKAPEKDNEVMNEIPEKIVEEEKVISYIDKALLIAIEDTTLQVLYQHEELTLALNDTFLEKEQIKVEQVVDLVLENEIVVDIVQYDEKISGKLLRVTENEIELEGLGIYSKADNIVVYQTYDSRVQLTQSQLKIGSEWTDFIVHEGVICGAIVAGKEDMTQIRVLLKTTDFAQIIHEDGVLESEYDYILSYEKEGEMIEEVREKNEIIEVSSLLANLDVHRIIIESVINTGRIQISSIKRDSGTPRYRGKIEVLKVEDGYVFINEVSLEEYLYSVVPSEMPSSYPMEALKAQAICARTYASRFLLQAGYPQYGAHVDDSVGYQVYNNIQEQNQTTTAVRETTGKIVYIEDKLAETYYYSTSCGLSNDISAFSDVDLMTYPYLTAKIIGHMPDITFPLEEHIFEKLMMGSSELFFEYNEPFFRWTYSQPLDTKILEERLKARYKVDKNLVLTKQVDGSFKAEDINDIGEIYDIIIETRSTSGCVNELIIEAQKATIKVLTQYNIRYILKVPDSEVTLQNGTNRNTGSLLPSAFFILNTQIKEGKIMSYTLTGGGYGHGVGMSQNGAKAMANQGYSCEEIIAFFYEGSTVGGNT